jgi:hypothetical protein
MVPLYASLCVRTPSDADPNPLFDTERKHEKNQTSHHPKDESCEPRLLVGHQHETTKLDGRRCTQDCAIYLHWLTLSSKGESTMPDPMLTNTISRCDCNPRGYSTAEELEYQSQKVHVKPKH